jgi:hypothetical protein
MYKSIDMNCLCTRRSKIKKTMQFLLQCRTEYYMWKEINIQ